MSATLTTSEQLAGLPIPLVIEDLSYDEILADRLAAFSALHPDNAATVALESDPVRQVLEVSSYRELLLRARYNSAAKSVLVQFATGTDLDHLAGYYQLIRKVIIQADNTVSPPLEEVLETDEDFRRRILLAPDGHTTAGSVESYIYHALNASDDISDAVAWSPSPCEARVSVLSHSNDGIPTQDLLDTVAEYLSDRYRLPLGDRLEVLMPDVNTYSIEAVLYLSSDLDNEIILNQAYLAAEAYTKAHYRLGHDIAISGIYRALHVDGVQRVELISPTANIVNSSPQASRCIDINLSFGGYDV